MTGLPPEYKAPSTQSIKYRVLFISPFFELEVKNGGHRWQPVRSTVGVEQTGITTYPLLHFQSYAAAVSYARNALGLERMHKPWLGGYFMAAPASADPSERYRTAVGFASATERRAEPPMAEVYDPSASNR